MALMDVFRGRTGQGRNVYEAKADQRHRQNRQNVVEQQPPKQRRKGWNLNNIPPEGDPDVGSFAYRLFEDSLRERRRLQLEERWHRFYQLFRGQHWHNNIVNLLSMKRSSRLSISLLHANITRTVANITARTPVAEVEAADGSRDKMDQVLSEKLRSWNNKEEQQMSLSRSALNMETYGITVEKAVFDPQTRQGRTVVLDPYSFLPAPGYYERLNDMPYMMHIFPMLVEDVEETYGVTGVQESPQLSSILGEERQDQVARGSSANYSTNYPSNYVPTSSPGSDDTLQQKRALVVELWIRDHSMETRWRTEQQLDPDTGEALWVSVPYQIPKYPGGIRVITFTNNGNLVLADQKNPNVNHALPYNVVEKTYLCHNFPFFKANSYEDTTSIWGYSMAETVGDLSLEIDRLWSSITNYLKMAMYPPLILPKDTNINKSEIRYVPRLILQPSSYNTSLGIRWLDMPTPPQWMFEALSTLVSFFDRISQVEDADRGQQPGSVIAASAIQMLQERGAVLIRSKIRSVDYLVRERGRCFISFYQNFGVHPEIVDTPAGRFRVIGTGLIGREFNYIVEGGSTVAKTSSEIKQEAMELFKVGAIDKQALLQQVNFPNWKQIVERTGESQLQQALQVLIKAGMPEDMARQLYNQLVQDQGGPGDASRDNAEQGGVGQPGAPAEAGTPKAEQSSSSSDEG
ncbi:MAG: hypothetical protein V5B78_11000 [Desulfohalobiaceae bacterium]